MALLTSPPTNYSTASPSVTKPMEPPSKKLQPPSALLIGAVGSGKTYSIATLLEAGLEVFVISTEPVGLDSLLDVVDRKKLDINRLHYKAITPARAGFQSLLDSATKVSQMTFDDLTKLRPSQGRNNAQWITLLKSLANFQCDRTGENYGPVDSFGPDRALVIDSLSGLNTMAMDITIGDKPTAHQGEWGVAMQLLDKLILNLTSGLNCIFVLTAHLERETNEVTGATQIMASALGRKLAPKLPRFFSEVVMAYREGDGGFYWSTSSPSTDLKNRALPVGNKLAPTFQPIVDAYKRRTELTKRS